MFDRHYYIFNSFQYDTWCHICGNINKDWKALREHLRIHRSDKFFCDLCGKSNKFKKCFIDHMYSHHIMNVNFKCPICFLSFRSEEKLIRHEKTHKRSFKCSNCDAAFRLPCFLKEHMQVQHEGKRYHCSFKACSSVFLNKASAGYHLRKVHSLEGDKYKKYREKVMMK